MPPTLAAGAASDDDLGTAYPDGPLAAASDDGDGTAAGLTIEMALFGGSRQDVAALLVAADPVAAGQGEGADRIIASDGGSFCRYFSTFNEVRFNTGDRASASRHASYGGGADPQTLFILYCPNRRFGYIYESPRNAAVWMHGAKPRAGWLRHLEAFLLWLAHMTTRVSASQETSHFRAAFSKVPQLWPHYVCVVSR